MIEHLHDSDTEFRVFRPSSKPFTCKMARARSKTYHHHLLLHLPCLTLVAWLLHPSNADVGTASYYAPPYLPTVCYGNDQDQFPANNMFAAAGEGIWDNGASCGRQYLVRCLSSTTPGACVMGQTIQVTIVDLAQALNSIPSKNGTTMVLSTAAYQMIANLSAAWINIELTQF